MLKIQGADRYLKMIEAPGWRFTKDQWEPEMWAKVFRKIDEERFFYCTHTIPRETYDLLPGRCGLDCLAEEGWCSPVQAVREMVETALRFAVADYRKKGIEPSVAFIREGLRNPPVSQQKGDSPLNTVIEAENLRKTFGLLVAVDDLSFSVAAGECFGILGPNGAGKTSTIRMVYAFSPPSGGTLHVLGLDITRQARAVKSRIGVCQQENNIDPDLTVLQNLEGLRPLLQHPRGRGDAALPGAPAFHGPRPQGKLPRGRPLGRDDPASCHGPGAPQPAGAPHPRRADDRPRPQSRHQVWERLEELRADGLSILLTTHNMDEASRLCDRLIIVDRGRLLVEGKPAELVRLHVGRHVIEIPDPAEGLPAFLRERGVLFENIGHRLIVDLEDGTALYREISERFCDGGCIMRMATLEDVFLRLTGRELRE